MKRNYLRILPTSILQNILSLSDEPVRQVLRTMHEFQQAFAEDARASARIASQAKLLLEPQGGDKHLVAVHRWVRKQGYMFTHKFARKAARYRGSALSEKTTAWATAAIEAAKSLDPECIVHQHYAFITDLELSLGWTSDNESEDGEDYVECVSVQFGPYVCLLAFQLEFGDDQFSHQEAENWSTLLDVYYLASPPYPWCFAASLRSKYESNDQGSSYDMLSCLQQVGNTPLVALEDKVRMTALAMAVDIGRWCPLSHFSFKSYKPHGKRSLICPLLVEHVARGLQAAGVYVENFGIESINYQSSQTFFQRSRHFNVHHD